MFATSRTRGGPGKESDRFEIAGEGIAEACDADAAVSEPCDADGAVSERLDGSCKFAPE